MFEFILSTLSSDNLFSLEPPKLTLVEYDYLCFFLFVSDHWWLQESWLLTYTNCGDVKMYGLQIPFEFKYFPDKYEIWNQKRRNSCVLYTKKEQILDSHFISTLQHCYLTLLDQKKNLTMGQK